MDQRALVDSDIALGQQFSDILKKSRDVRMEAAFWWQDEGEWRFIVATPVVYRHGRLGAYDRIRKALGTQCEAFEPILKRLDVFTPDEGIVSALNGGSKAKIPLRRRISDEALRAVYLPGAYFYYFAPQLSVPA